MSGVKEWEEKCKKKNLKAISSKRSDHHTAKKINNGGKCTLEN